MKAAFNAKNQDFRAAINIHVLPCLPNARADFFIFLMIDRNMYSILAKMTRFSINLK